MFQPRVLFRALLPALALALALWLAGCIMPARDEPPPAEVEEAVVEEVAEPAPPLTVTVTTDSNVRTGPATTYRAHFWLPTDSIVTVRGRNHDATWLNIEHGGRAGWIFGALTDIAAEVLAGLPDTMPTETMADAPAEAEPAPAAQTPAPGRTAVTVTGSQVNLRAGPSLEAPILAQVQAGDNLPVTGISADHQWLQIVVSAEHRWIYADWTDITGDGRGALAVVDAQALEACPETGPSPSLRCDKAVLLAVRDALRGSNTEALHTWHSANALADFEGVRVDGQPLRVVALTVAWPTELRGVLPPQLGQLRQLQQLDLRGHWLHGALPPEIGQLRQLRRLDLSFNELQGGLPPEWGQLTNLKFLDLAFNHLNGELPPELGQLTALEELSLAYNSLRSLPPELGQLTALHTLHLHNNRFSGPWPAELGRLPSLRELSLAHNWELTGPQPPALGPMHRVGPGGSARIRCPRPGPRLKWRRGPTPTRRTRTPVTTTCS